MPNTSCQGNPGQYSGYADYNQWYNQVYGFIQYIPTGNPLPWTYYEIGNEENIAPNNGRYPSSYRTSFAWAAAAVRDAYSARGAGGSYAVLTGGMAGPSPDTTSTCYFPGGDLNIQDAANAISDAENGKGVPASHLGVAVHPYGYNTSESTFWRNYYHGQYGNNGPSLPCGRLDAMINLWTSWFPGLPVVFTEMNYSSNPTGGGGNCTDVDGCEGTYLVDLFSWLYDHNCAGSQCDSTSSPLRVMWMRGANADLPLGIYDFSGNEKFIALKTCSNGGIYNLISTISNDYYYLRLGACY